MSKLTAKAKLTVFIPYFGFWHKACFYIRMKYKILLTRGADVYR